MDLLQCEVTWGHKLKCELKKHEIKKVGITLEKLKKWSMVFHVNRSGPSLKNELLN
jgi:hypothetical protein